VDVDPEPSVCVDQHVAPKALLSVVNDADFVTICTPSNTSTRGMIDASVLQAMKPDAVFINVGRGDLVDENALIAALKDRSIKGAALDVFATEPLATDSPLWGLDNVMLSPHCSSVFDGWERNAIRMFCDNIERWRADQPLKNVVRPPETSLSGARTS
jgi:phosphoglycerate dehydrogenase-like enzyme